MLVCVRQYSAHPTLNKLRMQGGTVRSMKKKRVQFAELNDLLLSRIKEQARETYGFDPADNRLGVDSKVAPNTLRNWASGKSPQLDRLLKIANHLGCEVWELLHPDIYKLRADLEELESIHEAQKRVKERDKR
jgi:transcriptional regulator with XRE-family HTH domain